MEFTYWNAMLEQSTLLVHAWMRQVSSDGAASWVRLITDAAKRPLGFVRLVGEPPSTWMSWLCKTRLEVLETDDASHLMSVTKMWGILARWVVEDAEERHVGTVYAKSIVSSEPTVLGYLDMSADGTGCVRDPHNRVMIRFTGEAAGIVEISFLPQLSVNPFVRMMMLASVLTMAPTPKPIKTG